MKDKLATVISIITLLIIILGGGIAWGTLTRHVHDIAELEKKSEIQIEMLNAKVDLMSDRISRIEGYLARDSITSSRTPQIPLPVAVPRPILGIE